MRLNWNQRQSPSELDDSPSVKPTYQFDLRRGTQHGELSWPLKVQGEKFGPRFIGKAWEAGLVVVAEIEGFPHPVAAVETRWGATGVLQVKCAEGWRVPERLWTRKTTKGLDSTGLLINSKE